MLISKFLKIDSLDFHRSYMYEYSKNFNESLSCKELSTPLSPAVLEDLPMTADDYVINFFFTISLALLYQVRIAAKLSSL